MHAGPRTFRCVNEICFGGYLMSTSDRLEPSHRCFLELISAATFSCRRGLQLQTAWDARTDSFAEIDQQYGTKPGFYLLVGPNAGTTERDYSSRLTRSWKSLMPQLRLVSYSFKIVVLLFISFWPAFSQSSNDPHSATDAAGSQAATNQTSAANAEALRKAAQNPVASLISVPIQNNDNAGIEPGYRTQNVLNIQPVIPVKLNENWNVIVRWITPIIYQPIPPASPGAPELGASGLGDMQPTFLFSPRAPHKIT
jgi:hypothetical protein